MSMLALQAFILRIPLHQAQVISPSFCIVLYQKIMFLRLYTCTYVKHIKISRNIRIMVQCANAWAVCSYLENLYHSLFKFWYEIYSLVEQTPISHTGTLGLPLKIWKICGIIMKYVKSGQNLKKKGERFVFHKMVKRGLTFLEGNLRYCRSFNWAVWQNNNQHCSHHFAFKVKLYFLFQAVAEIIVSKYFSTKGIRVVSVHFC